MNNNSDDDDDERILFLENNIASIFRIPKLSDQYRQLQFILFHSKEINNFLDDFK